MAYTIDTHAAVRDLTAAGLPAEQAEVIVATISRADDAQRANLATKADLAALKADLLARIDGNQAATQADLADLRADLLARLGATQAAGEAAIADLRADLVALKGELEARISTTQAAGQAAIAALEIRLLKWGVGIGLGIAGLLFAALRLTG